MIGFAFLTDLTNLFYCRMKMLACNDNTLSEREYSERS
jgi:hypothetical protein